jgi:hypothetical protein
MGLLDDAIREHLALKRRRGADPSEIAREETEALGPVRREDAATPAEPESLGSYADHEPAALDEPGAAYDDDDPYADEPADHLVPAEPPVTHDDPYAEPEEESATPPHGDPFANQQATREFSATELDDALGAPDDARAPAPVAPHESHEPPHGDTVPADDDESDDELEETPDFLQETPEHDRLWFEQKPPKDFDF